jgi:hypothetical protein
MAIQRPLCLINFLSWDFGFDLEFGICHLSFNHAEFTHNYDHSRFYLPSIEAYFRFNSIVFPVTLKLLKSMAHTATIGVSNPLMAMGMLTMLYKKENIRFW